MSAIADRSTPSRSGFVAPRRRVYLLVCLYRIACGILLLSAVYATDTRSLPLFQANLMPLFQGGLLLAVCLAYIAFGFFCVAAADRMQTAPGGWLLLVLLGDLAFLIPVLLQLRGSDSLGILLLPQFAATGWMMRRGTAFIYPAVASLGLLGVAFYIQLYRPPTYPSMLLQLGWQSFAYFVVTGLGLLLGNYNRASEELAVQRGIDLANLEQVNQLIIRDMDDGVLVVDEAGIVRNRNAQADRLLNREDFPLGNTRLAEFSPALADTWQGWFSRNGSSNATLQFSDPPRSLSVRIASVSPQRRGGCLIYVEDLSRAQTHAQQIKLAALGRLTASIAHEVRNPLSAINHATELLKESQQSRSNEADKRLLEIIHSNAQRISRLLQEVMQLNRRDTRQAQQIVLAPCISFLLNDIATAEQIAPDVIGTQVPPHLSIWFDQGHLGQVIWNLVRNALHYCQQRAGSIQLNARRGHLNGTVILEISDDGRGIPAEFRGQLFEPFFTTRTGGTGLGLYLARELTEANGGRLELVESSSGARFRLTMPSATT